MRLVVALAILGLILGSFPAISTAQPAPVWIDVEGAEGARLRAAVFRPQGEGPFPLVPLAPLIIQGKRDQTVLPTVARQYEQAARAARKDVETHYIAEANHLFIFDTRFRADVYRLTTEILNKHLR